MLHRLGILFAVLLFYIGNGVYDRLGFPMDYHTYLRLIFILCTLCLFKFPKNSFTCYRPCFIAIGVMVVMRIVTIGTHGVVAILELFGSSLVVSAFFYGIYSNDKFAKTSTLIRNMTFVFFTVECLLAIFERVTQTWVFGVVTEDGYVRDSWGDDSEFRSCALLGNPLQNALVVSTMMTFILFSSLKINTKLVLWILGYLAIVSFNTRSSMVANAFMFVVFLIYNIFKGGGKVPRWIYLLLACVIPGAAAYLFQNTELGGRLASMGLVDDTSAQVRLDTWQIFDYFDIGNFLFGHHREQADRIIDNVGLIATENFWIDWMLHFGLISICIFVAAIFALCKKLYAGYDKMVIATTSMTFWLIASTNNSLSATPMPILFYLLFIMMFSPVQRLTSKTKTE